MKILPPWSEILKSAAGSANDAIVARPVRSGMALGLVFCLLVVGFWPKIAGQSPPPTSLAIKRAPPCSELQADHERVFATVGPCPKQVLSEGRSIADGSALARSDLPPRDGKLTVADRAIVAPRIFRGAVWDAGVSRPAGGFGETPPTLTASPQGLPALFPQQ